MEGSLSFAPSSPAAMASRSDSFGAGSSLVLVRPPICEVRTSLSPRTAAETDTSLAWVKKRVETLWKQGISGADLLIACVGAGLRAFTRFARVEYANGEEVPAERFLAEVSGAMDLAVQAHLQKRKFIAMLMSGPNMPLWQIGKPAMDGRPYVELDKATYIIGLIGLNEAIQYLTGEELHESEEALKLGLKTVSYMYFKAKEEGKRLGMTISLEESPAESATRRLAKVDVRTFPEARQFVRGDFSRDEYYYTNSIHLRASAPVDILTRIRLQSKFHPMIESGAIIHAFVGEELPPAQSILNLVRKTFEKTQAAQLTISPEFTVCNACHAMEVGLHDTCSTCSSPDVYGLTRIVGYYSRITNWNKSKLGELRDRQAGNYSLGALQGAQAPDTVSV